MLVPLSPKFHLLLGRPSLPSAPPQNSRLCQFRVLSVTVLRQSPPSVLGRPLISRTRPRRLSTYLNLFSAPRLASTCQGRRRPSSQSVSGVLAVPVRFVHLSRSGRRPARSQTHARSSHDPHSWPSLIRGARRLHAHPVMPWLPTVPACRPDNKVSSSYSHYYIYIIPPTLFP